MEIDINELKTKLDNAIDRTFCKYYGNLAETLEKDLREEIRIMLWEYELKDIYNK